MLDRRVLSSLGAVAVVGCGARTSLGANARETFDLLRIGIGGLKKCNFLRLKRTGDPITLAIDATLPPATPMLTRMEEMALSAAHEALAGGGASGLPLGVLLATPHPRPGADLPACTGLAISFLKRLGKDVSRPHCRTLPYGHEGGLAAIFQAMRWLNAREIGACLVGGVESPVDLAYLDWLDGQGRLKGEERPFGFCPGEGAAFLLLVSASAAARASTAPLAWIAGVSRASEPSPWYTQQPGRAVGLTKAIAGLFTPPALKGFRADIVYSDLNGEPWRADEWAPTYIRTGEHHGHPLFMRHPADAWGDVGAGSGALLAAMAVLEIAHPRTRSSSALVFTASDLSPARAAALIVGEEGAAGTWQ